VIVPEGRTGTRDRISDAVTPAPAMAGRRQRKLADRLDLHNTSVDERVADTHRCGFVDLRKGRVCLLAVGHSGSCDFVGREEVDAMLRTGRSVTSNRGQPNR
jgi:hypothetical protein